MLAPNAGRGRLRWWRFLVKEVRHVLLERQPEVSDSRAALLLGCHSVVAWSRSSRRVLFHDDGRRQRQRREDESFHEWHVVVSPDTDEVCNSHGFEAYPKDFVSKCSATGALTGGCGQGFSVGEVCWLEAKLVGEVMNWGRSREPCTTTRTNREPP